jgi:hypothetical protein
LILDNADFFNSKHTPLENYVFGIYQIIQMLLLDYQLDGIVVNAMNGLETLDKVKSLILKFCTMLSSQDKIEVAINCMHHKALIMW